MLPKIDMNSHFVPAERAGVKAILASEEFVITPGVKAISCSMSTLMTSGKLSGSESMDPLATL